jgi:hypothetical protein
MYHDIFVTYFLIIKFNNEFKLSAYPFGVNKGSWKTILKFSLIPLWLFSMDFFFSEKQKNPV